MRSRKLTADEMRAESRRLYRNISARMKNIRGQETPVLNNALDRFRTLQETYIRYTSKMDESTLRKYYRDLKYIDNLKSSTVAGAIAAKKAVDERLSFKDQFTEKQWKKIENVYNKLVENNALLDRFKYDLEKAIGTRVKSRKGVDAIIEEIERAYGTAYEEFYDDDDALAIQFTENLSNIFDKYF